jgi:hypothetical protein
MDLATNQGPGRLFGDKNDARKSHNTAPLTYFMVAVSKTLTL